MPRPPAYDAEGSLGYTQEGIELAVAGLEAIRSLEKVSLEIFHQVGLGHFGAASAQCLQAMFKPVFRGGWVTIASGPLQLHEGDLNRFLDPLPRNCLFLLLEPTAEFLLGQARRRS